MENFKIAYLKDLEDLEDILDILIFEDKPSIFTEEYTLQFIETALHLMDEIIVLNPLLIFEPELYEILLEDRTILEFLEPMLFKGKSNLKRISGIAVITNKLFIRWNLDENFLKEKIKNLFIIKFKTQI